MDVDPRIVHSIILRAISDDSPREMAMLTGPVIKLEMTYRDAAGEHSRQYEIAKDSNLHGNLVTTRPAAILVAA